MWDNANVVVLDLEVKHSPDWCVHCFKPEIFHGAHKKCASQLIHSPRFAKIGWENHAALGISIGCYYDYQSKRYVYFDDRTLSNIMQLFCERQPLVVTFNGRKFDLPLMEACARETVDQEKWQELVNCSYDILHKIWLADPTKKFSKGNSLDAIASLNGYGNKLESGAYAPELWRNGEYARVINYCTDDVWKTRMIFEQICLGVALRRTLGDVLLPIPS